ncbi:MAG: hypothetical protein JW729_02870, partial [Bacteroidales bacterium]|nr:hypothetical protein [Bacteroidales bacterium]
MQKPSNNSPLFKSILTDFANNPYVSFNYKQIAKRLGIKDQAGKMQIMNLLISLAEQKILVESKRGKYQIHPSKITIYGKGKSYA